MGIVLLLEVLTDIACLSKWWKDFSRRNVFWKPITAALVPIAAADGAKWVRQKRGGDSYLPFMRDHGQSLLYRNLDYQSGNAHRKHQLGFEIWAEEGRLYLGRC